MALDRKRIVTEAVALLDEQGLDGVTLRNLARRLGVQAPTLYWHIPNKAALITAIAEEILGQEFDHSESPDPSVRWQDWLSGLAQRLRRALLAHPDGARVLSFAQSSVTMAGISELIRALSTCSSTSHPNWPESLSMHASRPWASPGKPEILDLLPSSLLRKS